MLLIIRITGIIFAVIIVMIIMRMNMVEITTIMTTKLK